MLDRLPASRRTGSRPLANFAVAAAVHAVLAAAALRATVAPPPHAPRIIDLAGYIDPVTAPPSRPAAPSPAPAGADGIGPPPSAPILPVLSAPTGIPPVESFRGPEALRAGAPAPLTPARPTGPAAPVAGVFEANDERVVPPRFVSAGPSPLAGSGVRGRAVFEFVVDALGHAEPQSIVVVVAPDSVVAAAGRRMVLGALFEPGRSAGRRIRVRVRQNVSFDP